MNEREVRGKVLEELNKCEAPISGIFVACAIFTEKEIYFGHNTEWENPVKFEHAEIMSLKTILQREKFPKINKIIMAGGGTTDKLKFYTPCYACCQSLGSYVIDNAQIILLPLTKDDCALEVTFRELMQSYSQLPYSKMEHYTNPELKSELESKTLLKGKDSEFISELTLFGREKGISLYLTGSASGRGGAGTMLNKKTNHPYRDIDVVAIIEKEFDMIELGIEKILANNYGSFIKEDKKVPAHHNKYGVVFKKSFYYCGSAKDKLIDFTFSTDLRGALAKNEYEIKNWFHQLC